MNELKPLVVVPCDCPTQIGESPQLDRLTELAEVQIYRTLADSPEELIDRAEGATVLINSRGFVRWSADALEQLPDLKMITTCSIGTDSIDLVAARGLGITVSNIPGKTAPVVAEHAIAMILGISKRLAFQTTELKSGRWTAQQNVMLAGKTLGLVGTGAIGSEVARLAKAIGMNVIAWTFNPSPARAEQLGVKFVDLDELLTTSDVVSLHVKLTDDSRGIIGANELARMKAGSLLVNTARGAVVDTTALIESLNAGHLAGAALDVFETEPLLADDPILSCEQVILTPHHADQTPEGKELLNLGAVDNVLAYLNGSPQNVVT